MTPRRDASLRQTKPPDSAVIKLLPPLKWAGGKRWQVPVLLPLWEPYRRRRFVEPFCGGLAATLGLMPSHALLNDINPHLVNFYRWLKKGLRISIPLVNSATTYYRHRSRFNELTSSGRETTREAASLFYYLNRTGFNGLCRFNSSGEFNVPRGRYKKINYQTDFMPYRQRFSAWQFSAGDFLELKLQPEDFVYADPPYDVEFTTYAKGGFGWDDQVRAATWLSRHRGPVILVNQATKRICDLYSSLGFQLDYLMAPRRISCTGDRTAAREVIATRNL